MGFATNFYKSIAWIECANNYKKSIGGLCEKCKAEGLIVPAEEVHHKIRLTPENLSDPSIALNWENLQALCKKHHLEEHRRRRWSVDPAGRVEL